MQSLAPSLSLLGITIASLVACGSGHTENTDPEGEPLGTGGTAANGSGGVGSGVDGSGGSQVGSGGAIATGGSSPSGGAESTGGDTGTDGAGGDAGPDGAGGTDPGGPGSDSADGWASENGGTTGGAGGEVVTVDNGTDLRNALNSSGPKIIKLSGRVSAGFEINGGSDKTIECVGSDSGWTNFLKFRESHNIIIKNCLIGNSGDDGLTIQYDSTNFWVDHCTFVDCGDGLLDITQGSDFVTVSWCRFYYTDPNNEHRLVSLVGSGDDNAERDAGHLNVTYHHNWFSTLSHGRMPRVRFGKVHVYNNYYSYGEGYGITAAWDSQVLVENNYFDNIEDAYNVSNVGDGHPGKLKAVGNVLEDCYGETSGGNDTVFSPPYSYSLDPAESVPSLVQAGAGHH